MKFYLWPTSKLVHDIQAIVVCNIINGSCHLYARKTIQSLHNDLMLIAENLESLYSWSLLFWLGNLSLHTVTNVYFIIESILVPSWEMVAWPLICCLSAWLVAFLFQLLLLHIACHFASSQVKLPRQRKAEDLLPFRLSFATSIVEIRTYRYDKKF